MTASPHAEHSVERVLNGAPTSSSKGHLTFDSIPSAIASFAQGEFIIVLDSPTRENEGDLILAAKFATPSKLAFMIRHTSGYLCAPMPDALADHLCLPVMVPNESSRDPRRTCYTVSVDAVGTGTGISAVDRARTCAELAREGAGPEGFIRPGHVLPLRAVDGGVRSRAGHTEATVEMCRLAGIERRVGVIGELVEAEPEGHDEEGRGGNVKAESQSTGMMKRDECLAFGRKYGIKVITITDLVDYIQSQEQTGLTT